MHTISILKWYQNSEENILKTRFFANLRSDQVQVGSRRTSASSVRKTPCRVSSSPTATRVLSIFANSGFQLIQPDLSCLKMYQCHFVTPDDLTFPASSSLFPRTCFRSCWQWCCQTFGHCCCCYCSGCFHSSCSRCCWRWRCWRPAGERGR